MVKWCNRVECADILFHPPFTLIDFSYLCRVFHAHLCFIMTFAGVRLLDMNVVRCLHYLEGGRENIFASAAEIYSIERQFFSRLVEKSTVSSQIRSLNSKCVPSNVAGFDNDVPHVVSFLCGNAESRAHWHRQVDRYIRCTCTSVFRHRRM